MKQRPSVEFIRERLRADFDTGRLYWLKPPFNRKSYVGCEAGGLSSTENSRYWYVAFGKKRQKRADLIFCLWHGKWPEKMLDHINGNKQDDRLANLREVTHQQNIWAIKTKRKTTEYPMGVRQVKSSRKYEARICCNGERHYLGCYSTPEEASAAYQAKRVELFGEFA